MVSATLFELQVRLLAGRATDVLRFGIIGFAKGKTFILEWQGIYPQSNGMEFKLLCIY